MLYIIPAPSAIVELSGYPLQKNSIVIYWAYAAQKRFEWDKFLICFRAISLRKLKNG
jgi:hypothetical protein